MILITGGAFQGKRDFAVKQILKQDPAAADDIRIAEGAAAAAGEIRGAALLTDYHLLVKRQLQEGKDPMTAAKEFVSENPQLVVTADELGCGIVPADAFDREWRETVGRCCCYLAGQARAVYRVTCGIGTRIK